ncbi:hypothetical protein GCM10023311_02920 [Flaviramulus aquimarinus]|uniref:Phage shock protein PspC N-terminal domain-containing protein n=1 Tax=Flaviramulus aquimarinus TaxID=1170456 RepID=A0ABP9EP40_9FLAO
MNNQKKNHTILTSNNKSDVDLKLKKNNSTKKLYRNTNDNVFAGVCSGLADYFDKSVIIIRFVFFILTLFFIIGLIIYIGLWIGMSNKKNMNSDLNELNIDSNPNKFNSILKFFKNLLLLIVFIILGCYLGFAAGGLSGPTGNGGASNFSGAVIGTILGVIIWIKIVSKKKS